MDRIIIKGIVDILLQDIVTSIGESSLTEKSTDALDIEVQERIDEVETGVYLALIEKINNMWNETIPLVDKWWE